MTKYLHQVGERIVKFSDAPLKVDGVKYYPKWPWSEDYRKCFRQTHARSRMSASRLDEINRKYPPNHRFNRTPSS